MKKKKRGVNPSAVFVISILIFIIPVLFYAFVWVPDRKAQLSDRYMKIVALMSEQLENQGKSITTVISKANIAIKNLKKKNEEFKERDKYIKTEVKKWITALLRINRSSINVQVRLTGPDSKKKEQNQNSEEGTSIAVSQNINTNTLTTLTTMNKLPGGQSKSLKEEPLYYMPNKEKFKFIFQIMIGYTEAEVSNPEQVPEEVKVIREEKVPVTLEVSLDVTDYIKEICNQDKFDDVLIIDDDWNLIYRQSRQDRVGTKNGLKLMKLGNMLKNVSDTQKVTTAKKNDEVEHENHPQEDAILSDIKEISIAQNTYKLYLQPIPLKFIKSKFEDNGNREQHWYVCGLLSTTELDKRSREISNHILLFFLLILALAFIAYPIARLWLMGTNDRFRLRDVIFLVLTLVVGIPVVTYSIFTITSYYARENNYENDLKTLANCIHNNFTDEIQTAYDQLEILNKKRVIYLFRDPWKKFDNGNNKDGKPQKLEIEKNPFLLKVLARNNDLVYPYFDMAFIMNNEGYQEYKRHTTSKQLENAKDIVNMEEYRRRVNLDRITFHNVSHREYFKNIREEKYWYTKNDQPMTLAPVDSISTGIFELNMAIPLENDKSYMAAAMSFRPLSIIKPVVPPYHGFAVIDVKGNVIFHSDSRMNLNENFFSECKDATAIESAIFAGFDSSMKVFYKGNKHDLYVKPIKGMPWTLLTFRDRDVHGSRNMEKISRALLGYSIYIAVLTLILLTYIVIWNIQRKLGGARTQRLYMKFSWIWPDKRLRWKYTVATFLNALTLALLLIQHFFFEMFSLDSLFLPVIILIPIYLGLMRSIISEDANNSAKENKSLKKRLMPKRSYWMVATGMFFLIALIVLYSQLASKQNGKFSELIFLMILPYLILLFIPGEPKRASKLKRLKDRWYYQHSHSLMLYTLLLLMIAYPSLMFYKIAHHEEMLTYVKYQQKTLTEDFLNWKKRRKTTYRDQEHALSDKKYSYDFDYQSGKLGVYRIPAHITIILGNQGYELLPTNKSPNMTKDMKLLPHEQYEQLSQLANNYTSKGNENNYNTRVKTLTSTGRSNWTELGNLLDTVNLSHILGVSFQLDYFDIIPSFNWHYMPIGSKALDYTLILKSISDIMPTDNDYSEKIRYLYGQRAEHFPLKWKFFKTKEGEIVSLLDYGDKTRLQYDPLKEDTNHLQVISLIPGRRGDFGYSLACFFLIALFLTVILYQIVHFIGRFIFLKELEVADGENSIIFKQELQKKPGRFFIFGKATKELLAEYNEMDSHIIDCASKDFVDQCAGDFSWLTSDIKFILVTNFDYKMHVPEFNLKKLEFLESLAINHDVNITVFSHFEPVQYFDFSPNLPQKEENGKNHKETRKAENDSNTERMHYLKCLFESGYVVERIVEKENTKGLHEKVSDFLVAECGDSVPYLTGVRNKVITALKKSRQTWIDTPGLKDRVFERAKPIYDRIWTASTRDEKLVMVQLAKYGLLNLKNREAIRGLLRRGLIKLSPLRMMNRTFTDYVLCAPDSEALFQWKKSRSKSRWSSVRKPFFFFAIGIMLFLVVTQPNLFKSWLLLLPAISAGIPAVLRLLDTVSGDEDKSD
jgi:hypothetical protein